MNAEGDEMEEVSKNNDGGNDDGNDDGEMKSESKEKEKVVLMWGYLPGVSPQRSPLLSPTAVPMPESAAGDSWRDVCGGGCGFAMAVSGIISSDPMSAFDSSILVEFLFKFFLLFKVIFHSSFIF